MAVVDAGLVTEINVRITPCDPVRPAPEKGRLTAVVCCVAILNVVATPIVAPAAFRNDTLPSHDATVPAVDAVAILVR